jgi:hypothetical protein
MRSRARQSVSILIASVGITVCLILQGLQAFIFAPLAGAQGLYLFVVLGLFSLVVTISALSFLNFGRAAALSAIFYAVLFTLLWWHFICKGSFILSDFNWLELPALAFAACVCIRSVATSQRRLAPDATTP